MFKKIFLFTILSLPALASAQSTVSQVVDEAAANITSKVAAALPAAKDVESLVVLEFKEQFEKGIADDLAYFEEHCGYKLDSKYDIANLAMGTSEEDPRTVSSYCSAPLSQLVNICGKGDSYKALVQKKVKSFSCSFLGNTGKRSLTLDGSTLNWLFEYETEKTEDQATYLSKTLNSIL